MLFGMQSAGPNGQIPAVRVTTTVVQRTGTPLAGASGSKHSQSAHASSSARMHDGHLIAPKPIKALRPRSTSPPPLKRARTDSLEPTARPKSRNNHHKKHAIDRVISLDVVEPPPSRSASPLARPKYVSRDCAADLSQPYSTAHIEASDVVKDGLKEYEPFFHEPRIAGAGPGVLSLDELPMVHLEYPTRGARESFAIALPKARKGDREGLWDPVVEIVQSIVLMLECYLTPAESLQHFEYPHGGKKSGLPLPSTSVFGALERAINKRDRQGFVSAIDRFNQKLLELKTSGLIDNNIRALAGVEERLWQHICGQAYDRTVGPRSDSLNVYQSWSSNVYGELLPPFVADIIHVTDLRPGKVCIDLGSGVGNCLVQTSLAAGCESHGFEVMAAASACAALQVVEAHARWQMWGFNGGEVHAVQADFVKDSDKVLAILQRADVIICNNFVFTAELNGDIVQLLLDAKDGAQVVHLKPFAPATTERSLDSPAAILRQGPKRRWGRKYVSWTDVEGDYYVSTVDREAYQRRIQAVMERSSSRPSSRNAQIPMNGASSPQPL